jgi:hypothetical protein
MYDARPVLEPPVGKLHAAQVLYGFLADLLGQARGFFEENL